MSLRKRESGFLVGTDETTGEDEYWGQDALRYGGYITMGARGGKTTFLTRLAHYVLGHGSPGIIIDDAGELWNQLRRSVAWSAWQLNAVMQDAGLTAAERLSVIRARYVNRYSFAFMGSGTPNHVTLDLLKRRRLPERRETIEEVVSGNMRPFEARFKDIEIRTKFITVIGPSLAALVAGERPITELWDLLLDPKYWWFIRSEIMRLRVLDDPVSREYLVPQMLSLRHILDMRIRYSKSTGPIEAEPYPQPYLVRLGNVWEFEAIGCPCAIARGRWGLRCPEWTPPCRDSGCHGIRNPRRSHHPLAVPVSLHWTLG